MTANGIYTPLEIAMPEIQSRWHDQTIKNEVEKFLQETPRPFHKRPRAVLFRHIASPDHEFFYFSELAEKIALEKLGWEYLDDYFCSRNEDKMRLAKMTFSYRKDKHNNPIITYRRIINIEKSENKKLRDLKTHWGEGFVTFHHKILESHFSKIDLFDASTWLKNKGSCASEYYKYFLGLFLCHGVLFEDFVTNRVEKEFFEGVVYPAFNFLEKEFGLRPLIVHLRPKEYEDFKFWWGYKEEIKNTLDCTDTQSDMIQSDRIFVTSREG